MDITEISVNLPDQFWAWNTAPSQSNITDYQFLSLNKTTYKKHAKFLLLAF